MVQEREDDEDWDWNPDQPKQNQAHDRLLVSY
jgi:hypothetical protein